MKRFYLYKLRFNINGNTAATLIAAVNKDFSHSHEESKEFLVKEVYGNYTADNDCNYDENVLADCLNNSSCSFIGELIPSDPILEEVDDFYFIKLQRTEAWEKK